MINFTARFTKEEKLFFFSFKANKVMLHKSEENKNYLNTKTDINKISCFIQIATVFNLEKTFDSFFQSELNEIVNNLKFMELEYVLVKKLLLMPRHDKNVLHMDITTDSQKIEIIVKKDTKKQVLDATKAWLGHKSEERKKHEKCLLAKVQAALEPITL